MATKTQYFFLHELVANGNGNGNGKVVCACIWHWSTTHLPMIHCRRSTCEQSHLILHNLFMKENILSFRCRRSVNEPLVG